MRTLAFYTALFVVVSAINDIPCNGNRGGKFYLYELCEKSVVDDALVFTGPNRVLFFMGDQVALRYENRSIGFGYPMPIVKAYPLLPSNIDSAFTYSVNNKVYFTKGSLYWQYNGSVLDEGYPKRISEGFAGVPDDVDAATEWDQYIYFFKGEMYYRYDPCQNQSYSAPVGDFLGIPQTGNIDAIIRYPNGYAYFFKGELYYQYQMSTRMANPPNPYVTSWEWFGCRP